MKEIKTVDKLKTLIKEKILPAYEEAYADENADYVYLDMDLGICYYAKSVCNFDIYCILEHSLSIIYIAPYISEGATKHESLLPRIEWMRKFVNG